MDSKRDERVFFVLFCFGVDLSMFWITKQLGKVVFALLARKGHSGTKQPLVFLPIGSPYPCLTGWFGRSPRENIKVSEQGTGTCIDPECMQGPLSAALLLLSASIQAERGFPRNDFCNLSTQVHL